MNERFVADLDDIAWTAEPTMLRQKSADFAWFSPILRAALADRLAELVVEPRSEAEVVRIAAAAARHRVPLTARGAGTGTFGQAVPLAGGAVVDFGRMDRFLWRRGPTFRAQAGLRLGELDARLRDDGHELRIHPSTKRLATLGGFVAGGHAGIGCVEWGILRDRGNLMGLRVVTCEETPRVLEIRGERIETVHHAYGVNGLITEVEMPTAPARAWREWIASFESFDDAARFGHALAAEPGLAKKVVALFAWAVLEHFEALAAQLPAGRHAVLAMVAPESAESAAALAALHRGRVTLDCAEGAGPEGVPLYEYTWGHATWHGLRRDPSITYLACVFDPDRVVEQIVAAHERLGVEAPLHVEFIRFAGRLNAQAVPLVHYFDDEQLAGLTAALESVGGRVANVHTYHLQNGGMKRVDEAQLAFKREVDPHGLLNPGKIAGYEDAASRARAAPAPGMPASGWAY